MVARLLPAPYFPPPGPFQPAPASLAEPGARGPLPDGTTSSPSGGLGGPHQHPSLSHECVPPGLPTKTSTRSSSSTSPSSSFSSPSPAASSSTPGGCPVGGGGWPPGPSPGASIRPLHPSPQGDRCCLQLPAGLVLLHPDHPRKHSHQQWLQVGEGGAQPRGWGAERPWSCPGKWGQGAPRPSEKQGGYWLLPTAAPLPAPRSLILGLRRQG